MPNETWQSDFTHYPLTDTDTLPKGVEIISWLDDCTRYALHVCRHTGRSPRDRDRHLPRSRRSARKSRIRAHRPFNLGHAGRNRAMRKQLRPGIGACHLSSGEGRRLWPCLDC
jgi:hypothetical protein